MPVTQEATLQPVDLEHNQFQCQFGVSMTPGENPVDVSIPNQGTLAQADTFTVDFSKVNTPARGNFPAFRYFLLTLRLDLINAGAAEVGEVYILNPRTSQLIVMRPRLPAPNQPTFVVASLPFFVKSNQQVLIYRARSINCVAALSGTAITFDTDAYVHEFDQ
jgi:hypothetical protein